MYTFVKLSRIAEVSCGIRFLYKFIYFYLVMLTFDVLRREVLSRNVIGVIDTIDYYVK